MEKLIARVNIDEQEYNSIKKELNQIVEEAYKLFQNLTTVKVDATIANIEFKNNENSFYLNFGDYLSEPINFKLEVHLNKIDELKFQASVCVINQKNLLGKVLFEFRSALHYEIENKFDVVCLPERDDDLWCRDNFEEAEDKLVYVINLLHTDKVIKNNVSYNIKEFLTQHNR